MRKVTRLMISEFHIKDLGYDFMGYHLNTNSQLSFHHLLIPRRENGPYANWNGAILCKETSHPYLHIIESKDYDIFCNLTSEMCDMNIKGYLDPANLRRINDLLLQFESDHGQDRTQNGKLLIKEEYKDRINSF